MKCEACGGIRPADRCAMVEAKCLGREIVATIFQDGRAVAEYGPGRAEDVYELCHVWAKDRRYRLHWHWAAELASETARTPQAQRWGAARPGDSDATGVKTYHSPRAGVDTVGGDRKPEPTLPGPT